MRFFSIRWRLVLSYVLLTVLTVSIVGAVALTLVQQNLEQRERDYLTANAKAVARQALPLMQAGIIRSVDHSSLQQLADMAAFLGNTQVRILDKAGNPIVDSGPDAASDRLLWIVPPPRTALAQGDEARSLFMLGPLFSDRELAAQLDEWLLSQLMPNAKVTTVRRFSSPYGDLLTFDVGSGSEHKLPAQEPAVPDRADSFRSDEPSATSTIRVHVPIGDQTSMAGTVEMSGRLSFGSTAVATTRQAFLFAAVGATALAVLAGLLVSRGLTAPLRNLATVTNRMAQGDLSVRASVRAVIPVQTGTRPASRPPRDEIEQLSSQFNQMAAKLEGTFNELSAERDALRRFIADASHELRTPITALRMYNDLMLGPAANDAVARAEFLEQSQIQLHRLQWITQNLLDLSRLDAGLTQLNLAEHDVNDLLQAAAAPFRALAEQKKIDFVVEWLPSPITLRFDQARIEIALSNLIDNALKFTPEGGRVRAGAEAREQVVQLFVQDSGIGIPEADQPHIFERFYRGSNTRTEGSGLGLAIVKSIVQAHGGRAFVESRVGEGSRFVIELPI
jgi:signal transduction histidine kinase